MSGNILKIIQSLLPVIFIMLCSYLLTKGGNLLFPDVNLVVLKALVDLFLFFTSYFIQKQFIFFKKG